MAGSDGGTCAEQKASSVRSPGISGLRAASRQHDPEIVTVYSARYDEIGGLQFLCWH
ncbi:hypothetical protein YK56LOC_68310 [Caballeronia sp. HLA56]